MVLFIMEDDFQDYKDACAAEEMSLPVSSRDLLPFLPSQIFLPLASLAVSWFSYSLLLITNNFFLPKLLSVKSPAPSSGHLLALPAL